MIFNTKKVAIYTEQNIGDEINIFEIIEKKGNAKPLAFADLQYVETKGEKNIIYRIVDMYYFNTVEIGIKNKEGRNNTNIYRIYKNKLVFDPYSSNLDTPFSLKNGYIYVLNYYYYNKNGELKCYQHYFNNEKGYTGEI